MKRDSVRTRICQAFEAYDTFAAADLRRYVRFVFDEADELFDHNLTVRDAVADIAACALLALATMERRAGKNTEREALIAMVLSIHQYDSAVKHAAKWQTSEPIDLAHQQMGLSVRVHARNDDAAE